MCVVVYIFLLLLFCCTLFYYKPLFFSVIQFELLHLNVKKMTLPLKQFFLCYSFITLGGHMPATNVFVLI